MKNEFKKKVVSFLKENGVDVSGKKCRVYNTRRYGFECRFYTAPMEYVSERVSFRKERVEGERVYGTRGHHTIRIPMYVHINEEDLQNAEKSSEEKEFLLAQFWGLDK